MEADDGDLSPGGRLIVRASVALGALTPDDVTVEVVYGRAGDSDEIIDPASVSRSSSTGTLPPTELPGTPALPSSASQGRSATPSECCPGTGCWLDPAELGLVAMPSAPGGMVNGDLRYGCRHSRALRLVVGHGRSGALMAAIIPT